MTCRRRRQTKRSVAVFHCLSLFILLSIPGSLLAGSLQISPILVDATSPARAALLTLVNEGDETVTMQFRLFAWNQSQGERVLTPTDRVVSSPPIAEIKPGMSQVIRIIRIANEEPAAEEPYRMLVDQLPKNDTGEGIQILVRYSVPVFFAPTSLSYKPQIDTKLSRAGNQLKLSITNRGERRVRLSNIQLRQQNRTVAEFSKGLLGYILPGSTMSWEKPLSSEQENNNLQGAITLTGHTEAGELHEQLFLQVEE